MLKHSIFLVASVFIGQPLAAQGPEPPVAFDCRAKHPCPKACYFGPTYTKAMDKTCYEADYDPAAHLDLKRQDEEAVKAFKAFFSTPQKCQENKDCEAVPAGFGEEAIAVKRAKEFAVVAAPYRAAYLRLHGTVAVRGIAHSGKPFIFCEKNLCQFSWVKPEAKP